MHLSLYGLAALLFLTVCQASSGDQLSEYQQCVTQCVANSEHAVLPLHLQWTMWTPEQDCRYQCAQLLTEQAKAQGTRIHQFHGKWPFRRLWGMQEPASVLFSILNGVMHARYLGRLRRQLSPGYRLKPIYMGMAVIAINTWVWSTVFHTRDFDVTEKLDYFSAGLYILYGLYLAVLRIFRVHRLSVQVLWTALCAGLYVAHVTYLWRLERFDYGYNMTACIIVGACQTNLWLWWSMLQYTRWGDAERRPFAWQAATSVILISCAMALEVFDFPPWFDAIDAHSLWHAATVPIIPLFYNFLIKDAMVDIAQSERLTNAYAKRKS